MLIVHQLYEEETFRSGLSTQVVKLRGKGVLNFINGKFTAASIVEGEGRQLQSMESPAFGIVRDACFLTSSGRALDTLRISYFGNEVDEDEAYLVTSTVVKDDSKEEACYDLK